MAGFEPANDGVKVRCLTAWLHPYEKKVVKKGIVTDSLFYYGVDNGARTHDTRNHNPVLCQLSYIHHILVRQEGFEPPTYCLEGSCSIHLSYWRIPSDTLRFTQWSG